MHPFRRGDFVELDGLLAVVVGIEGDKDVPEDHLAIWFGDPRTDRKSAGGMGGQQPEVWTVSAAYFDRAPEPTFMH